MVNTRAEYQELFDLYVPIALAVAAIVFLVVLFALVRYRRRDDRFPNQRTAAHKTEGLYVLFLAGVAAVLLAFTFSAEERVDRVSPHPGLKVAVTASNWRWQFDYPGLGVRQEGTNEEPATLVVPTGKTVRFELTSLDVIHSFYVSELRFKRDAFPNRIATFDLVFPDGRATGGQCAEYCGLKHGEMLFRVQALPPPQFDQWLRERRAAPPVPA